MHGKRLLSPFLQRKASLPSHHQSRSTDRAAHGFHAFQGAPIARQSSTDRDTHRRFNTPTNAYMASPRPKGSTSPIGKHATRLRTNKKLKIRLKIIHELLSFMQCCNGFTTNKVNCAIWRSRKERNRPNSETMTHMAITSTASLRILLPTPA